MGLARDDLVIDVARHVDGTVHMFEGYGLPHLEKIKRATMSMKAAGRS